MAANAPSDQYLCLNVDEEVGTTVIAETDNETLLAMLQNKLTMEQFLGILLIIV